jgi:hypothetical protein
VRDREPYSIRRCVKYSGSNLVCKAGVDPGTLRDDEDRIPCVVIRGITGKVACPIRQLEPEPAVAERDPMARALDALLHGRCPSCGEPTTGEYTHDDGRVFAMPCRHVIRSVRAP